MPCNAMHGLAVSMRPLSQPASSDLPEAQHSTRVFGANLLLQLICCTGIAAPETALGSAGTA